MDSLLTLFKKNTVTIIIVALLVPIGLALIYGALKSVWVKRRNKKERAIIFDFLLQVKATEAGISNDEISKGTGLPKDRVVGHCIDHPWIADAGKRQRSWKLVSEAERK